ncbi:unnamed protein product [Penicillium salamii]|nr:unnamed protein product [Penicillium salamii]
MISFKMNINFVYVVLIVGGAISVIFGAISWARASALYLPLPIWMPAVATLITPITIPTLISTQFFSMRLSNGTARNCRWSTIFNIIAQAQTVILTVVATAALAHLFPNRILLCHLEQQWQTFFQSKNSHAIRSIQDEFRCCGLRSLHDRAWPFKDQNHGDNACELQLAYTRSCFTPWSEHQRITAWMIFAAVVFAFAAKVCKPLCHIGVVRVVTDTVQLCADCISSAFRPSSGLVEHAICQQEA